MWLDGILAQVPGLKDRLTAGANVFAAVGAAASSGAGDLTDLATRFQRSNFVGFSGSTGSAGTRPRPERTAILLARRVNLRWARRGPAHLVDTARFDLVVVATALGPDHAEALSRIHEALRLGGVLLLRDRAVKLQALRAAGLREVHPRAGFLVARRRAARSA